MYELEVARMRLNPPECVASKNVLQFLSVTDHNPMLSNWTFQYSYRLRNGLELVL